MVPTIGRGWPRRGVALLVALAVLSLLSTLAVTLARLGALERSAAASRSDEVRARLVAAAGVERAVAELRVACRRPWDGPDQPWFYRGRPGLPAGSGVPIETADRPSFAERGRVHGRVISGRLPGTYEPDGDTYVLRVVDAASRIDLNQPIDPRRSDLDQPLVRMLSNLAAAIDPGDPVLGPAEAAALVAWRRTLPGDRFADPRDLLLAPGGLLDPEGFEALAPHLTTHAPADPDAIGAMDPAFLPPAGELVFGRVPTGEPLRLPRRPVDCNTAAPPVLAAVLAGVSALRIEADVPRSTSGGPTWHARGRSERTSPIRLDQALRLADLLVRRRERAPLASWTEFAEFLDDMVGRNVIGEDQAAALLANADPNVDSHRANPDAAVHREVDRFDVVEGTTEFSFASGGVFEIESIGRITHLGGVLRASARIEAVVRIHDLVRHTTQARFETGTFDRYVQEEPILYQPQAAILTQEDLEFVGGAEVRGRFGSVHSNGDLELIGNARIDRDATASGDYDQSRRAQVGGLSGGGFPAESIPDFRPETFRDHVDVYFAADGSVYDASGNRVATGEYFGFRLTGDTWIWSGGSQPTGILSFEGNVEIRSSTNPAWRVSLLATGHVTIRGNPNLEPDPRMRLTIVAGTDIDISGTPGARISGLLHAGEQVELGGNTEFLGAVMAQGRSGLDPAVAANRVHGNVRFAYDGLPPIPLAWTRTDRRAVTTYPSPAALAPTTDHDGWLSLATLTTNRAVLGGEPYYDRLLARWSDGLDADLGGGALALAGDRAGPVVAPLASDALAGHLLPDGLLGELDAVAAFEAPGNVGPRRGTIAFWFKPAWSGGSNRTHHLVAMSRTDDAGTQSFQFARAGDGLDPWSRRIGFHFERSTIENPGAQRLLTSTWSPPPHRWSHIVLVYDLEAAEAEDAIRVYVDGVEIPGAKCESVEPYALDPREAARSPITPGNLLRLGERVANAYQIPGASPDATYDELVVLPEPVDGTWAAAVHGAGRFVSFGPAAYVSADLPIRPEEEVLHATWTVRPPAGGGDGPVPVLSLEDGGRTVATTTGPGFAVGRRGPGPWRFSVRFLDASWSDPIYESPAIDDVTIARAGPPRFIRWSER